MTLQERIAKVAVERAGLKFYYNGIKDGGGQLQTVHYSLGQLLRYPEGTITIYAREYHRFSQGIRDAFKVDNDSDMQTDYFEKDRIRVLPTHPLYAQVKEAHDKARARYGKAA